MTDHDSLFAVLAQHGNILENQSSQLEEIKKTLIRIAVQEERISNIQGQMNSLSVKFDGLHSPDGAITKLQACASSCPRESFKNAVGLQWTAIGIIIALITVLKIWG